MNIRKILEYLQGKGVEPSATELAQIVDEKDISPAPTIQTPTLDTKELKHNKEIISELQTQLNDINGVMKNREKESQNEIEELKKTINDLTSTLQTEKETRDAAIKRTQEELEARRIEEKKALVKSLIDKGITSGKIAPKDETTIKIYTDLADKDIDNTTLLIDKLPVLNPSPVAGSSTNANTGGVGSDSFNRVASGVQDTIKNYVLQGDNNSPSTNA